MKHIFTVSDSASRLLMIFADCAVDPRSMAHVSCHGYDSLVVYDYSDFAFDWSVVAPYSEVVLVAHGFGVYAAAMTIHAIVDKITAKIAVNGTLTPVDNQHGIPLSSFKDFRAHSTAALAAELDNIYPEPWFMNPKVDDWDRAVIGRFDSLFPPFNQQRAWQGIPITAVDLPHDIDLRDVVSAFVVNKDAAAGGRISAAGLSYESDRVCDEIARALVDDLYRTRADRRLSEPGRSCLEIGSGRGTLSRRLAPIVAKGYLYMWDLLPDAPAGFDASRFTSCDAELRIARTLDARFDLIASSSTVQWFNSPMRFMRQCARVLRPGGILLLSGFVRGNMHQLALAAGQSHQLPTLGEWRRMIPADMETLSFAADDYDLAFDEPLHQRYPRMLDGRCHLTYKTVRLVLRKQNL